MQHKEKKGWAKTNTFLFNKDYKHEGVQRLNREARLCGYNDSFTYF